jgi:hypothetical protein
MKPVFMMALAIISVAAPRGYAQSGVETAPLRRGQTDNATLFRHKTAQETGISLAIRFPRDAPLDWLTWNNSGNGVCIGDYDGDGLPDVYFTNYSLGNRLYRNKGNWRFEDVTVAAGVTGAGRWCGGSTFVDIDNDGDLDLYVCAYDSPNLLYINKGDGTFENKAAEYGLSFSGASVMMAFADYDADGDMDGYLVTNRLQGAPKYYYPYNMKEAFDMGVIQQVSETRLVVGERYQEAFGFMYDAAGKPMFVKTGQRDYLYRNEGNGKFIIANEQVGIGFQTGMGMSASWWDFNDDGKLDLYVSNDFEASDRLYRNNGDGTFKDVAKSSIPHMPWYSMGADVGDIDNDGRMDFLATDMAGTTHYKSKLWMGSMDAFKWFLLAADPKQYMRNALYLNTGTEVLLESAAMAHVTNSDWTWSPKFGDLDNDGRIDLFISNGMSRDFMNSDLASMTESRSDPIWWDRPILKDQNLAFRNKGYLDFEDVSNAWGLDEVAASYGAALGDLDRDGDLDLVVSNFDQEVSVYENTGRGGNALLIRLQGKKSNRWGVGAKVTLNHQGQIQARQLTLSQGYMSSNDPLVHFGLGAHETIEKMTIDWPSGIHQELTDIKANQLYTIAEPDQGEKPVKAVAAPLFARSSTPVSFAHHERDFDDLALQLLIPRKVSRLGPGIAVGDVNHDGQDDYFFGGAAGQSGELVLAGGQRTSQPFERDKECEDLGAVFFDADSDGDQDLYVVSGSNEFRPNAPFYGDRLYLNQGGGQFAKAPAGVLPAITDSGSAVAAADFDRDGDLDLFVGGFAVPGEYPTGAKSHLLRNNGGKFESLTAGAFQALHDAGLVTSALWSDANNDGWADLLVTHQWGPVRLYLNDQGMLVDRTAEAGLTALTGWWTGIGGGDIDHDGDIDYVVTNNGLNTKYKASSDHPAALYYGDVVGDGKKHIVEAKYQGDVCLPVRGRSCSTTDMPALKIKFPTYDLFARATLEDIYTPARLEAVTRFDAVELSSGILVNDGQGGFAFRPLPRIVQIAPGNSVAMADFNGDGHVDLFIAQNNFTPEFETGHFDGGVSQLLLGDGAGNFNPLGPLDSGLIVRGDARSAVVTDLNRDGRPDLLIGRNDAETIAFENRSSDAQGRRLVHLKGQKGNPDAVGAKVTATYKNGAREALEVGAGGGYLSQSSAMLNFSTRDPIDIARIEVRWPDGTVSATEDLDRDANPITIVQPARTASQTNPSH